LLEGGLGLGECFPSPLGDLLLGFLDLPQQQRSVLTDTLCRLVAFEGLEVLAILVIETFQLELVLGVLELRLAQILLHSLQLFHQLIVLFRIVGFEEIKSLL